MHSTVISIEPTRELEYFQSYKQWSLDKRTSVKTIKKTLSCIKDQGKSSDGKSTHTWDFIADYNGHFYACSIWDYKGARWSAFGPREVFEALGFDVYDLWY